MQKWVIWAASVSKFVKKALKLMFANSIKEN